jgi:hypothetical protein
MEVVQSNAAGLWTQLQSDLPTAFSRAFDRATIHGLTMKGAAGPFADYLTQTTKSVALGTASQATGGIWKDIVDGMEEIVDDDWDYTGTVADHRLKPRRCRVRARRWPARWSVSRSRTRGACRGRCGASRRRRTRGCGRSAATGRRPPTASGWTSR